MSKFNSDNEKHINETAKKELNRLFEELFVKELSDKLLEVYKISESVQKDIPQKVILTVKSIDDRIDNCQKKITEIVSETNGLTDSVDTKVNNLIGTIETINIKIDGIKECISDSINKMDAVFKLHKEEAYSFHSENHVDIIKHIKQASDNEITKLDEHKDMLENSIATHATDFFNRIIERINKTETCEIKRFKIVLFLLTTYFLFTLALFLWVILNI